MRLAGGKAAANSQGCEENAHGNIGTGAPFRESTVTPTPAIATNAANAPARLAVPSDKELHAAWPVEAGIDRGFRGREPAGHAHAVGDDAEVLACDDNELQVFMPPSKRQA